MDYNTGDEFYEECRVMEGRGYDDQALKVNGFTKESIYDNNKQNVIDLIVKFEEFCKLHNSKLLGAWGDYDRKMLLAAYDYYGREWQLPDKYTNLKDLSKQVLGDKRSGLSNTAIKLNMPPEQKPHIGINGARLAVENISVIMFGEHYYSSYKQYMIPDFWGAIPELSVMLTLENVKQKSV